MPVALRPLTGPDFTAARALADAVLGDAPYAESLLAPFDEHRAIVAYDGTALIGLVIFGETAGALGAGRIYVVAVDAGNRRRGIATALTEAACTDLRSRGARFAVIELPDEPGLEGAHDLAYRTGFHQEGRVSDYVRDGVGLALLRRDL